VSRGRYLWEVEGARGRWGEGGRGRERSLSTVEVWAFFRAWAVAARAIPSSEDNEHSVHWVQLRTTFCHTDNQSPRQIEHNQTNRKVDPASLNISIPARLSPSE
jgi:hypothetical protein